MTGREKREAELEAGGVVCRVCGGEPVKRFAFLRNGQRICTPCMSAADTNSSNRRRARERTPEGAEQVYWRLVSWRRLKKIKEGRL